MKDVKRISSTVKAHQETTVRFHPYRRIETSKEAGTSSKKRRSPSPSFTPTERSVSRSPTPIEQVKALAEGILAPKPEQSNDSDKKSTSEESLDDRIPTAAKGKGKEENTREKTPSKKSKPDSTEWGSSYSVSDSRNSGKSLNERFDPFDYHKRIAIDLVDRLQAYNNTNRDIVDEALQEAGMTREIFHEALTNLRNLESSQGEDAVNILRGTINQFKDIETAIKRRIPPQEEPTPYPHSPFDPR